MVVPVLGAVVRATARVARPGVSTIARSVAPPLRRAADVVPETVSKFGRQLDATAPAAKPPGGFSTAVSRVGTGLALGTAAGLTLAGVGVANRVGQFAGGPADAARTQAERDPLPTSSLKLGLLAAAGVALIFLVKG